MDINTLEAALGFGAGVAFISGVGWAFVVTPLKAERDKIAEKLDAANLKYEQKLLRDIERLNDFINRNAGAGGA